MLINDDCLNALKQMQDNSIDSLVTDPPYGLKFMSKKWDYSVPSVELWREALRVLKPGGHLLSFGGTRTYHRMVVNIEDAGFEIRDQIQWLYGSGFPKSHNISKSIDKKFGAKVEYEKYKRNGGGDKKTHEHFGQLSDRKSGEGFRPIATSDLAKQYDGWGTALKPANEPVCLARKPLDKGLTIAQNVLKWGTGGINIDGCRIGTSDKISGSGNIKKSSKNSMSGGGMLRAETGVLTGAEKGQGRFPANIILDETAAEMLDEQSGEFAGSIGRANRKSAGDYNATNFKVGVVTKTETKDFGGASRFFYIAKASKRERGADNHHPTVKPIRLMEYLCKLITPPNGTILDPFMGSGTTGIAAKNLGFEFVGIERELEYCEIAEKRINQI